MSVQKWGNSAAVRLPTELLAILKVALGDKRSVNLQPDGVLLKTARPSYWLAELVAQCDAAAPEPEPVDMAAWSLAKPVGREAW